MGSGAAAGWQRVGRVFVAVVLLGYPPLVWFGLTHGSARTLALVLLCLLLPAVVLRLRARARNDLGRLAALPLVTVVALVLAAALDSGGYVLAVPVVINAVLLVAFGATLRRASVPMVERIARLQLSDPSPAQRAWCRAWTRIWCGFFAFNGSVALVLALVAPLAWWALYNGLLAYGLMGLLFASEWILRRRRFGAAGAPAPEGTTGDGADLGAGAGSRVGGTDDRHLPHAPA